MTEGRTSQITDRNVYLSLLQAAESCLEHEPYDQISVRKIANIAGVNPAMINYYFNSKKGLFIGLIGFVFGEWRDSLLNIEKGMGQTDSKPILELVNSIDNSFLRHKSILNFVVYELMHPNSVIREGYLEEHASRCSAAMYRLIEAGCQHGVFRQPSNTRFLAYSIVTTILHPFSLGVHLKQIYGFGPEVLGSAEWKKFLVETLGHLLMPIGSDLNS